MPNLSISSLALFSFRSAIDVFDQILKDEIESLLC
jgi:hypothetical protein